MNTYELKNIQRKFDGFCLNLSDFCLEKGNIYAVTGPNGCGKSTFLNILALLDRPTQGDLVFRGYIPNYTNGTILSLRRNIGYLLQNPYLFDTTVYNNVAYGMRLAKMMGKEIDRKVQSILSKFSLSHLAEKNAYQLSGGEAQKVALARILVLERDVLLLDEPTANVDRNYIRVVEEIILELNRDKQTTIIVTTHSQEQAYRLSQNIIPFVNGKMSTITYENVYQGILKEDTIHNKYVVINSSVTIHVGQGRKGEVLIALDPQDIILSNEELESSALNRLYGTITKIEQVNGSLRVFVDVGIIFCTLITQHSFYRMGLNIGQKVWVIFKANSVKIL